MKLYKHTIDKPFDVDIPTENIKKGDVGIYSKHIKLAIKGKQILEVTTPSGVTYADPVKIKKSKRIIYRYYKRPDEPMLLYILTPKYNNRSDFEEPERPSITLSGVEKMLQAWKEVKKRHLIQNTP